jgi:Periplasmic binding protein
MSSTHCLCVWLRCLQIHLPCDRDSQTWSTLQKLRKGIETVKRGRRDVTLTRKLKRDPEFAIILVSLRKPYYDEDPSPRGLFRPPGPSEVVLMQVHRTFVMLAAALASISATFVPSTVDRQTVTRGDGEFPFVVDVVANGIPEDGEPTQLGPDDHNEAPGLDLWIGALTAYSDLGRELHDQHEPNPLLFKLCHHDDNDKAEDAQGIAKGIASDPRTLAVVGHGITVTTSAAGPIYSRAGIPLIVALATGESAVEDSSRGGTRLPICYRLPPSDSNVQAPAIAYMVKRLSPATGRVAVHLYTSSSENAGAYSEPLCRGIHEILKAKQIKAHLTPVGDIPSAVEHIHDDHQSGDIIVYCGYKTEASLLLSALRLAYAHDPPTKTLNLILSDASFEKVNTDGPNFHIYETSPLDLNRCIDAPAIKRLSSAAKEVHRPLTAEQIHGYDAVMILEAAAKRCFGKLSRGCVLGELDSGKTFPSVCSDYSFRNGENIISDYYIFGSKGSPQPSPRVTSTNSLGNVTLAAPEILDMLMPRDASPTPNE